MSRSELPFLTITELSSSFRKREVSPVEATQAMLHRIESIDPKVHSFLTVTAELAEQQAKEAEADLTRGKDLGPLHGVPVALKDLYATEGIPTTAHSKVLIDWVPEEDATATRRLREAGSVLLGKLAMHEFAFGTAGLDRERRWTSQGMSGSGQKTFPILREECRSSRVVA